MCFSIILAALAALELIKENYPGTVEWGSENVVILNSTESHPCQSDIAVLRVIARYALKFHLYGTNVFEQTQIDNWLSIALIFGTDVNENVKYLQKSLASITYLVGNKLTIADLAVFVEINKHLASLKPNVPNHVQRWFDLINSQKCVVTTLALEQVASSSKLLNAKTTTGERKQEGKFVDLPGAEMGKVVVRFPPEASGYLHIGHAKAALLNQYYQQAFEGKLIMRFDDTNPAKENVEFEKVILEDLEMLQIKPDLFTHTSQYFDLMLKYCETLLTESKAYVDDTKAEQMKIEREQRVESVHRNNSEFVYSF